jgi:RimJ/RimL family protein N-acetyltransferase
MERDGYSGEGWRGVVILAGQSERVRDWICSQIRDIYAKPERDYEAIGVVRGSEIIGGVLYHNYHEIAPGQHDIMMSAAGHSGWLSKATLRIFFSYPFQALSCVRITTIAAKSNRKARSLNDRLGFKMEGVLRDGRGVGRDSVAYSMLKHECRWI